MFQRVWTGFVAGAVIGVLIVVALLITDTRVHDTTSSHTEVGIPSEEAALEFVDDWRRMREGTWVVDATFTRVRADGQSITGEIHEAQRPPERVRVEFGTSRIERENEIVVCAPDTDDAKGECRSSPNNEDYEAAVEDDLRRIRTLVVGPASQYGVAKSTERCYVLQATSSQASSTWGERSTFCFDDKTGAIERTEIVRGDVTDATVARSISSKVDDSEFRKVDS
jgi:hypothetical protein